MGSPVDLTLGHHHHHNNNYAAAAAAAKNVDRKGEEYLRALEDERRKIEGFKRELPLCIQLLEDGKNTNSLSFFLNNASSSSQLTNLVSLPHASSSTSSSLMRFVWFRNYRPNLPHSSSSSRMWLM